MMNELEQFYKIVVNYDEFKEFLHNTDGTSWIDIYDDDINNLILGVSQDGKWILKHKIKTYILNNKKMFLYCTSMLEVPYETIKIKLEERFEKIIERRNINIITIFPFYQIVEFGLNNLFDDYWFDLAMMWFEELELSVKFRLKDALNNISQINKISQKNRQRARSEIKKLETLKNINN